MDQMGDTERPQHPLRMERLAHGWTQKDLAEKINVEPLTVGRWERGESQPHPRQIAQLCELFDKSARQLGLTGEENDTPTQPISYFAPNEPLVDVRDFYGRKSEKQRILRRIRNRGSISIVGPRRVGKTWLLTYLRLVASQELGEHFQVAYLNADLPRCSSVTGFVEEIIEQMGSKQSSTQSRGLRDLQAAMQEQAAKDKILVLCIDEFESLTRLGKRMEFSSDFYHQLRALEQALPLVLVLASRKPLHILFNREQWQSEGFNLDDETSTFQNVFEQIRINPFSDNEANQFIEEKGRAAHFTPEEIQYLRTFGQKKNKQWFPILLQAAGNKIWMDKQEGKTRKGQLYREELQQWFEEFCHNIFPGDKSGNHR